MAMYILGYQGAKTTHGATHGGIFSKRRAAHSHALLNNHCTPFQDHNSWHHYPKVDMNKFDGSDPSSWVTQMEHYFSLHGITNDLMKLRVGVLYLDLECWKWYKKSHGGYISWSHFVKAIYARFE
jgi:hypothetical protein